jgi:hypothetical protein
MYHLLVLSLLLLLTCIGEVSSQGSNINEAMCIYADGTDTKSPVISINSLSFFHWMCLSMFHFLCCSAIFPSLRLYSSYHHFRFLQCAICRLLIINPAIRHCIMSGVNYNTQDFWLLNLSFGVIKRKLNFN